MTNPAPVHPPAPRPPLRAGSVPYLNVAPIVPGLEGRLRLLPPSQLAIALRTGEIDAGLLSITEALFHDDYDLLDGPCVASFGDVLSVFLAHRRPLADLRRIHCDTASLTSVNLLRVLLAERSLHPELIPLDDPAHAARHDAVLLIGDPAIEFIRHAHQHTHRHPHPHDHDHAILDLGGAWREQTGKPFVFAAWVLRRDADTTALRAELRAAAEYGRLHLDAIIRAGTEFDEPFRRRYLTRHVRSLMGPAEKEGIAHFVELLRRHGDRPVYDPNYVR